MTKLTISEMKKAINDFKQSVVAMPKTVTYVPDKSKFKTVEDVVDYLMAIGVGVTVVSGRVADEVDMDTVKRYSKVK